LSNNDLIVSDGALACLTNNDITISGSGTVGDANLVIINGLNGTIAADGGTLILSAASSDVFNFGLMAAEAGGRLIVQTAMSNFGAIEVKNGSTLTIAAAITNAN